jgi:steroid delta-isomerase-like uncharacterized protein
MSDTHKSVIRRFYEEINKGNLDVINDLASETFVEHEEFPGLAPSREGVRQLFQMFRDAFSDFAIVTDDMVAEGDKVFVRAHMTGTHRGEFMGIAATGRSINVPFADIVRFENGKVVEHWGITDTGAMMQQLGQAG